LLHHVDVDLLREAYRGLNPRAAPLCQREVRQILLLDY
jgi:hypothetical protein